MTAEEEIKDKSYLRYLLIVLFIIPLSGLGTDITVPSLPAISNAFHITTTLAQTTVAIYIFGYGGDTYTFWCVLWPLMPLNGIIFM